MDLCHYKHCQYVVLVLRHIQKLTGPDIKNKFGIHIWNQYMDKLTAFKQVCHRGPCTGRQTDRRC